jgi:hypothetical protein
MSAIMYIPFRRILFKLENNKPVNKKAIEVVQKQGLIEPLVVTKSKVYEDHWVVHPHHVELAQAFIYVAKRTSIQDAATTLMCVDYDILTAEERKQVL